MKCNILCNLVSAAKVVADFFAAVLYAFYDLIGNRTPGKAAA